LPVEEVIVEVLVTHAVVQHEDLVVRQAADDGLTDTGAARDVVATRQARQGFSILMVFSS